MAQQMLLPQTLLVYSLSTNANNPNSLVKVLQQQLLNQISLVSAMDATNATQSNFFGLKCGQSATGASYSNFIGHASAGNGVSFSNFFGQSAGYQQQMLSTKFLWSSAGSNATNASYSNFMVNNGRATSANSQTLVCMLVLMQLMLLIKLLVIMLVMVQQMHLTQVSLSSLGKMQ
jgi:hypothetical protein